MYTSRERVMRAVRGDSVDRVPWTLYRHFYEEEATAEQLAKNTVAWNERWGFDVVKVQPRAAYYGEDWGAEWRNAGDPPRPARVKFPVATVEDWDKIKPLDPRRGSLGEHIEAVRLMRRRLSHDVIFIDTNFLPLSMAGRLLVDTPEALVQHIKQDPKRVHRGLKAITETWIEFVRALRAEGVDGIYFAVSTMGRRDQFTEQGYYEFGRPYDLAVINEVQDLPFNVLHVCGSNVMLNAMADYPVAALALESTDPRNETLAEALMRHRKAVIGGVRHKVPYGGAAPSGFQLPPLVPGDKIPSIATGTPEEVLAQAGRAYLETGGRRWILGTGCNILAETPEANIAALKSVLPAFV